MVQRSRSRRSSFERLRRRFGEGDTYVLSLLYLLTLAIGSIYFVWPTWWPLTVLALPLVLGSVLLGPRHLPWFVIAVLTMLALALTRQPEMSPRIVAGVVVIFGVGLIVMLASFRRTELGVGGLRGESMLVDLRDRILSQGKLPALPADWYAESALRSAGGTSFAGDFVVAYRQGSGPRLDLVVADVSGKGVDAGTRSLLLSGAFSGLLTAVSAEEFLPAANRYLLRQDWDEGFATAVHLSVDLESGDFEVRTAGHPPALHLDAGTGRWGAHETDGPILGLFDGAEFEVYRGRLNSGDAIMLYTDGLVESPTNDLTAGIDRLAGEGEKLLQEGFDHGARRLIDRIAAPDDDRALLLIHRR
ncbi:PP2C family protein-serine/threonine phosphatase [Nocardioides sp. Bht2]|uniref:PP2C family protein-serine/threonine phosphatase n=1 Tax=Nocardioides sp. Bht2 TaxID=3392297 RepID=UPI0039B6B825